MVSMSRLSYGESLALFGEAQRETPRSVKPRNPQQRTTTRAERDAMYPGMCQLCRVGKHPTDRGGDLKVCDGCMRVIRGYKNLFRSLRDDPEIADV